LKIDCTKLSNKDDVVCLVIVIMLILVLLTVITLQVKGYPFLAGIVVATAVFKWKNWIYRPVDAFLDKLWPAE